MSSDLNMPWELLETCNVTGRKLWKRHEDFEHTGNNEGTMTNSIRVTGSDDSELFCTSVNIDWEYHGFIDAEFAKAGTAVRISTSEEKERIHDIKDAT